MCIIIIMFYLTIAQSLFHVFIPTNSCATAFLLPLPPNLNYEVRIKRAI
jgi:hypothetical protein